MLTPSGQPAHQIDKVMLLSIWANVLRDEMTLEGSKKQVIFAGLGKPTYPINAHTVHSYLSYWQNIKELSNQWYLDPEMEENPAIDYGDPRGDSQPRALMAKIMSTWYDSDIRPEHILFTVGGIGALRVIFETFNTRYKDIPGYRIITPFPHYSAYSNNPQHRLHPIHVMKEPGYRLTARALESSIQEAYSLAENDYGSPKAILLCNPSNPLGNIIDREELIKIADVLRHYPDLHIILDEAYTEMSFVEMPSFLKIAPDLKTRIMIMRSATKAFSAAGERMAVLLVFEAAMMNEMLNKNISYFVHAPRSSQIAYAYTLANFDAVERNNLVTFYKNKVTFVIKRLQAMGAAMPDSLYQVEATFYALGDFSDLFGLLLPDEAKRALQKTGSVSTDEELAYYLLFNDAVMVAPLSYFGLAQNSGFMRITCSGNERELQELMNRLEHRLLQARTNKKLTLFKLIRSQLTLLEKSNQYLYGFIANKIDLLKSKEDNCLTLKEKNQSLEMLLETMTCRGINQELQHPN